MKGSALIWKRVALIILSVVFVFGAVVTAIIYYRFVSQTIYDESVAHLTEIYRQVNQSLRNLVGKNWNDLELWSEYLSDVTDDEKKDEFIEKARQSTGFTDFYFISRDGNYCTANGGEKGNLGLGGKLPELISDRKNVVVKTVVPGKSEIMVFAVPVEAETYREFAYEAVAISFDNGDLVKALDISVYKGVLGTYVVHADGRVVVDNAAENIPQMYNFFAMLEEYSRMSPEQISSLQEAFKDETHARGKMIPEGSSAFVAYIYNDKSKQTGGRNYYFVYEHLEFDDWVVVGMVPTSVVNANMTKMQTYSVLIAVSVSVCLLLVFVVVVVRRTSAKLKKKDKDILYREELFARLSVNVDDVFLMLDAKAFRVDYISPNIEKLIGVPEQEARDNIRALDRLVDNDDTVRILDVLPDLQPDEQGEWDREYVHQQTGEVRWFHVVAICSNIQGEKKYILVMSDRTNDKKINQALEEAVAAAQSSSRAKSTFLSNMSHDIRTPMNAIIGFATLAAANSDNNEKVKDYLAKILSSGNHLLSLINDILDMSRIESGKIRIEETEANLSDMLHDIKVIIGGQIHAKQLNLFMDAIDVVDEDVICDKTRINQVLLNLLSNAVKFTPPGGTIAVRVAQLGSPSEGTGSYEIRVKDTGIGMNPEFVGKIFEPFEREHTATVSKIQGTGLGMAITKNIIDMMGGTIEVNSEPGKGTEFVIRLTLKLLTKRRREAKINELEGLKALVVDDDFNTCDSVTKMLRQVGMRPEWTLSGKEAVLRAKQSLEGNDAFRAYIVDWRLPDMNGIEVTRQIRSLDDNTPIIILTAYDWSDIEEEAIAAGVTAFCSKPMFMSDLRESLLTALGRQRTESPDVLCSSSGTECFAGKKLLLVEDNELNREIAVEIFKEYGFVVDVAENGKQAVDKISASAAGDYDLVLMDIQMPIMDGYEATRLIRRLQDEALASIPVIAMTANAFDEDRNSAFENGMNGFLSKPIDIKEVIATLQSVFGEQARAKRKK